MSNASGTWGHSGIYLQKVERALLSSLTAPRPLVHLYLQPLHTTPTMHLKEFGQCSSGSLLHKCNAKPNSPQDPAAATKLQQPHSEHGINMQFYDIHVKLEECKCACLEISLNDRVPPVHGMMHFNFRSLLAQQRRFLCAPQQILTTLCGSISSPGSMETQQPHMARKMSRWPTHGWRAEAQQ